MSKLSKKGLITVISITKCRIPIPLSILCFLSASNLSAQCDPKKDSLILVDFYNSTNGDKWVKALPDSSKWKVPNSPIDKWKGITLNDAGCVIKISTPSDSLDGTLPSSLADLSFLEWISISSNKRLRGPIPNFTTPSLSRIWLYYNQLEDTIPNFKAPNLTQIWLDRNQLKGNVPNFNLSYLERLWLDGNQLTGTIPKLDIVNLKSLNLGDNQLRGVFPSFDLPYLEDLYLNDNFLEGNIPNFKMPNLKILNIADNLLVGSIPNFDCPIITNIQLGNNKLTGTIPKFNFPLIDQLKLANNKLFGCIPKEIKKNCPLLGPIGGDISNNANLSTKRWIDYWEKGDGSCPLCDSVKTSIEGLNTICKGGITNFVVKSSALLPTYLWSSGGNNNSIQVNNAGLYTVTITQADGCSKTASITLTVNDSIIVKQDTSILVSVDFKLPNGLSAASTGSYRSVLRQKNGCDSIVYTYLTVCTEKGKIDSTLEKITIRQSDSATLKNGKRIAPMFDTLVIDTIRLPCSIRYDKTYITVKPRNFIKTAITPNNDGINDKLDIPIIDWQQYPLSRIEIFNRWSQQVYMSEPYQKDWAGQTNDGKELPEGDYFFILSLKPNGDVLKGTVHIFR